MRDRGGKVKAYERQGVTRARHEGQGWKGEGASKWVRDKGGKASVGVANGKRGWQGKRTGARVRASAAAPAS